VKSDAFRRAVEVKDFSQLEELFAPEVVFRSPAVFKPYEGLEALRALLGAVAEVLEDFRYVDQVETGDTAVLVFHARAGERELDGVDILRFAEDGRVGEMMVMIRPLTGLTAVAEEMGRRLGVSSS
jgi:SnoaL-like protein